MSTRPDMDGNSDDLRDALVALRESVPRCAECDAPASRHLSGERYCARCAEAGRIDTFDGAEIERLVAKGLLR